MTKNTYVIQYKTVKLTNFIDTNSVFFFSIEILIACGYVIESILRVTKIMKHRGVIII